MPRLFVALRPPRPVRERLLGMAGGVPGARWQDDEQLHLTLRFIGEVDRRVAEDIALALGAVRAQAFQLGLCGVGRFGRRGGTASLWAGVSPQADVAALARKVDACVSRMGLPREERAYLPHLTVARFGRRTAASPESWLERWAGLAGPNWSADAFHLYESVLGGEGASYIVVARYPLAPANSSASARAPAETSAQVVSNPTSGPS